MRDFIQCVLFMALMVVAIFGAAAESKQGVFIWMLSMFAIGVAMWKIGMFDYHSVKK
jgi:hypothetical protein